MVAPLNSVQPVFTLPPIDEIPDGDDDKPVKGLDMMDCKGRLRIQELIFGAGNLSSQYNDDEHLASTAPLRTIRLCLRYGICTFDTSPYYGPSEIVLGTALKAIEQEFPRSSYTLMTKCGRYGSDPAKDFDYSPATIRKSVERSLARLNTTYLDTVYLHDVEFVCTPVAPRKEGNHITALTSETEAYGLDMKQYEKVWGEGDQKILDGFKELQKMKDEGLIKSIGITGYQLPTLLRLAHLIRRNPPYSSVDVILSYSHMTIQNDTLKEFLDHFTSSAIVGQIVTASPLSMGLLTQKTPVWHPATENIKETCIQARKLCEDWDTDLPNVALRYAYKMAKVSHLPTVVGCGSLKEVHETMKIWRELTLERGSDYDGNIIGEQRTELEDQVIRIFEENGAKDYSWPSPPV